MSRGLRLVFLPATEVKRTIELGRVLHRQPRMRFLVVVEDRSKLAHGEFTGLVTGALLSRLEPKASGGLEVVT